MKRILCFVLILCMMGTVLTGFARREAAEATEAETEETEDTEEAKEDQEGYTIDNIRSQVVGVDEPVELEDGTSRPVINFDNAATTPAFQAVMDEVSAVLAVGMDRLLLLVEQKAGKTTS